MITRHAGGIRPGGFFSSPAPWWGLFLPAKTAPAVVARLHSDATAILAEPAIQKRMQDLGSTTIGLTPEELRPPSSGRDRQMGAGHSRRKHSPRRLRPICYAR
jgi:hypothetical protein